MTKPRKTQFEREQERDIQKQRAWGNFRIRLEAVQSYEEAYRLISEAPAKGYPGHEHYSNFSFFLQNPNITPAGSNAIELHLYSEFRAKMQNTSNQNLDSSYPSQLNSLVE